MQRLWLLKTFYFGFLWQLKSMHIQHSWCILCSFMPVYSFTGNRSFILSVAPRVEFHIFPYPNCLLFLLLGNKTHWKQRFGDANLLNPIDKQVWLQLHSAFGPQTVLPRFTLKIHPKGFITTLFTHTRLPCVHNKMCKKIQLHCACGLSDLWPFRIQWLCTSHVQRKDCMHVFLSHPATPCVPVWTDTSSCPFFLIEL